MVELVSEMDNMTITSQVAAGETMYDDEYDDTYDSNEVGAADADEASELMGR